jgi:hypothetical protein
VRETSGDVTVISGLNGTVEARGNLPISPGDEVRTDDPGRAEIALADGNVLHVGGGTSVQFVSLYAQQGSDDDVSAISLRRDPSCSRWSARRESRAPHRHGGRDGLHESGRARARQRGSAPRLRGRRARRLGRGAHALRLLHVRAGNYLLAHGEEEPEIARGSFSRDRFDSWAADRLQATYDAPHNASSQYVGEDYAATWPRSTATATGTTTRPTRAASGDPRSPRADALLNGSWYYTRRPDLVVAGFVGLVPLPLRQLVLRLRLEQLVLVARLRLLARVGLLGLHGRVCRLVPHGQLRWLQLALVDNYYRNWNYPRNNLAFAIHGNSSTRRVDMRGWNFTGSNGFGTTRGAWTSSWDARRRPARRTDRGFLAPDRSPHAPEPASARMRDYVRERRASSSTAGRDADKLEPVLATTASCPARRSKRCADAPSWPSADA